MKITAQEASTKRCQEGFAAGPVMPYSGAMTMGAAAVSGTWIAQPTSPMNCIAGGCMAWQWTDHRTTDGDLLGYCGKCLTRKGGH
jgi:hypothetical protein